MVGHVATDQRRRHRAPSFTTWETPKPTGTDLKNRSEIVSFLWGVADLIRSTFKRDRRGRGSARLCLNPHRLSCLRFREERHSPLMFG